MSHFQRRDLTIIPMGTNHIVMACDSCGGIGHKPHDTLSMSPYYVGKFTARVSLTEVLCIGATPVAITNGVACEMEPTGSQVIQGIRDELAIANLPHIALTGSTEENFPTSMTAVATTVVGVCQQLKHQPGVVGDTLVLIDTPKVGTAVDLHHQGLYTEIQRLLALDTVKEIVPVGSKGIGYEAHTLAALSGRKARLHPATVNYAQSAGPATCLVVLCSRWEDACQSPHPTQIIGDII